jgi:hypothetical protein
MQALLQFIYANPQPTCSDKTNSIVHNEFNVKFQHYILLHNIWNHNSMLYAKVEKTFF